MSEWLSTWRQVYQYTVRKPEIDIQCLVHVKRTQTPQNLREAGGLHHTKCVRPLSGLVLQKHRASPALKVWMGMKSPGFDIRCCTWSLKKPNQDTSTLRNPSSGYLLPLPSGKKVGGVRQNSTIWWQTPASTLAQGQRVNGHTAVSQRRRQVWKALSHLQGRFIETLPCLTGKMGHFSVSSTTIPPLP